MPGSEHLPIMRFCTHRHDDKHPSTAHVTPANTYPAINISPKAAHAHPIMNDGQTRNEYFSRVEGKR